MSKRVSVPITLLLALATAVAASAQQVSDAEVKELTRLAMQQAQSGQTGSGPTVELKVDDAVARAMANNLNIAVQRLTPQTYDYSLMAAQVGLSADRSRRASTTSPPCGCRPTSSRAARS